MPGRAHRAAVVIAIAAVAIALVRIAATWPVFNATFDEPAHIAAGMEWLDRGRYQYEPLHPPLARAATALGPWLAGARATEAGTIWQEGSKLLYEGIGYWKTLTLARAGILPFFVLMCAMVWRWASRYAGVRGGAVAVLLVTMVPPVLGHAGLATTDIPFTGALLLALMALMRWSEAPVDVRRAAAAGAAVGFCLLTKFSTIPFLVAIVGAWVLAAMLVHLADARLSAVRSPQSAALLQLNRTLPRPLLAAFAAFTLIVWSGYLFRFGYTDGGILVPASGLWTGLAQIGDKASMGADAFLLGEVRTTGWWYFFLVSLAVKTPLPFLALGIGGSALLLRNAWTLRDWRLAAPVIAAAAIVATTFPARINIGVRHVMPVFPLLAIAASLLLVRLWDSRREKPARLAVAALLCGWLAVDSARAHPDYLAYFNETVGTHPEYVLVNGDLDWGQDLHRLADTVRARGIDSLEVGYFGSAFPSRHLKGAAPMTPYKRPNGWFAVSEAVIAGIRIEPRDGFRWIATEPNFIRVGKSIRLYHLP